MFRIGVVLGLLTLVCVNADENWSSPAGKEWSTAGGDWADMRYSRLAAVNRETLASRVAARNGSWTTGPIKPGESGRVTIATAAEYEYICRDHPWSLGQLIVE
jgi:hypothetical protein